jgi:hypothetical protein
LHFEQMKFFYNYPFLISSLRIRFQ